MLHLWKHPPSTSSAAAVQPSVQNSAQFSPPIRSAAPFLSTPNPNHHVLPALAWALEKQLPMPSFWTGAGLNSKLQSCVSRAGCARKHSRRPVVSGWSQSARQGCWLQPWLLCLSRPWTDRDIYSHLFMGNITGILQGCLSRLEINPSAYL